MSVRVVGVDTDAVEAVVGQDVVVPETVPAEGVGAAGVAGEPDARVGPTTQVALGGSGRTNRGRTAGPKGRIGRGYPGVEGRGVLLPDRFGRGSRLFVGGTPQKIHVSPGRWLRSLLE